ncbi:lipase member H-A-like [Phlebotomus argentipes]|uniref:lipase member H-A-like n=1 Tax=Phlebotomus argentipes TaxID=94469 RepID=UPI0028937BE3|nr:lipase member H-A-like [Phlebotomus argentipes]
MSRSPHIKCLTCDHRVDISRAECAQFHEKFVGNTIDEVVNIVTSFDADKVFFYLYTRQNPKDAQDLFLNSNESIEISNFRVDHPTRFIIHGWNNNADSGVNVEIRDAYLLHGEFNVIVVDWSAGALTIDYPAARSNVHIVGPRVAEMIDFLNTQGMPFENVTVIGHSLGAHTAGIVGKHVTRGRLPAIVALDPALPHFTINRPEERIALTDADFIEVIHTNAGLLGFDLPIGMVDFYPNWGISQPGCRLIDVAGACSHARSYALFAESINSGPGFVSRQCRNYGDILNQDCVSSGSNRRMGGEPLDTESRGVFWLPTNDNAPFAKGDIV